MFRQHADGLWTWSLPLTAGPFSIGMRATILRCGDGLLLHSPIPMDKGAIDAVKAVGTVKWVVAPSSYHHKHVKPVLAAFPGAKLVGAPALVAKRKDLTFDQTLDRATFDDVTLVHFDGAPDLDEYLFIHRPTKTLIATDWLFNIAPTGFVMRWYLGLTDGLGKPTQTWLTRRSTKDKAAARRTRDAVLALDFDRLVVTHGDVLETGAKAAVTSALAWLG